MREKIMKVVISPLGSTIFGYLYIIVVAIILYRMGFYEPSTFFSFGIPVKIMGKVIDNYGDYVTLILTFFFHQIINNWVNNVTYPWIVNCVQDPKSERLGYSKWMSLVIINLFAFYSQLDMMFIVTGILSQFMFFMVLVLANVISTTFINWQYIKQKDKYIMLN